MKAKYARISTANQNIERQLKNEKEFDFVYVDICSGVIPFKKRPEALNLIRNKKIESVVVAEITRLGRNMRDILKTIEYFTEKKINIHIENLGISTMVNGESNKTASLIINLLSSISEYERDLLQERTQQGREIAKLKGLYKGRKRGAKMKDWEYRNKYLKEILSVRKLLDEGKNVTSICNLLSIPRSRYYDFKKRDLI